MLRLEWKGSLKNMSCIISHYFLNFSQRQISWNLISIFLCSLFDHIRCPYNNCYSVCFYFPHLSNFNFQIFTFVKFFKLFRGKIAIWCHTHIHQLTRFGLLMFNYDIWPISLYCSVGYNGEIPGNGHLWGIHNT